MATIISAVSDILIPSLSITLLWRPSDVYRRVF